MEHVTVPFLLGHIWHCFVIFQIYVHAVVIFSLYGMDYLVNLFPDYGWVADRVFFCNLLFLFIYAFLVITVLVFTLYWGCSWCVFLWRFSLLNCGIPIITIHIIFLTIIISIFRFLINMGLRFGVDWCKNWVGNVASVVHSRGMCSTTLSSSGSGSGNIIGVSFLSLYGVNRGWGVLLQ